MHHHYVNRQRPWVLLVPLIVALTLTHALASVVEDRYLGVRNKSAGVVLTTPLASYRTVTSGSGDSTTAAAAISRQTTGGDTTIVVAPRLSGAAATCVVQVWLYQEVNGTRTLMGISDTQTATAGSSRAGAAGMYLPDRPLYFSTNGADEYDVRATTISAGTADLWVWTIGANSKAAQ